VNHPLIRYSPAIMSSQITTMKTSTIVAITVGTIVTGFLGTRSLTQNRVKESLTHTSGITAIGLADLLVQLTQSTSTTRDERIQGSGKP
jgi:hypothetical protein